MRSPRKRRRGSSPTTLSLASFAPRSALAKFRPLFSYSYESLFLQPLSSHIHTNPPGVSPTPRSLLLACSASSILSPVQSTLSDGTRPKSFIIRSYEKCTCNPFRIRSYKNTGGGYPPRLTPLDVPTFRYALHIPIQFLDSRRESTKTPSAGDACTRPSNVPTIAATWTRTAHPMNNAASSKVQVYG